MLWAGTIAGWHYTQDDSLQLVWAKEEYSQECHLSLVKINDNLVFIVQYIYYIKQHFNNHYLATKNLTGTNHMLAFYNRPLWLLSQLNMIGKNINMQIKFREIAYFNSKHLSYPNCIIRIYWYSHCLLFATATVIGYEKIKWTELFMLFIFSINT